MKVFSLIKNGMRKDYTAEEFTKMLEESKAKIEKKEQPKEKAK
jgi:hypothetical protein